MLDTPFSFLCLQDLPPAAARFCLNLERFCREELECGLSGTSVLIAFSSGADSLALLLALRALSCKLDLTLHAAMLDHGLRPESEAEAAAAADLCASLGVAFHTCRLDVAALAEKSGCGLEEAGREARRFFLETTRARTACDWIAQGHQLNDLAEDSLMRLMRGAGWPALAGMPGLDRERRILRPLLLTPRSAIESFLRDLGRNWNEDPLNRDQAYLRNRVRQNLVPLLLEENPAFLEGIAMRWRMARIDATFFAQAAEEIGIIRDGEGFFLSGAKLAKTARALRLRMYKTALDALGPGQVLGSLLLALDKAWQKGEGGKLVQFPGCKTARIRDGGIVFGKAPD